MLLPASSWLLLILSLKYSACYTTLRLHSAVLDNKIPNQNITCPIGIAHKKIHRSTNILILKLFNLNFFITSLVCPTDYCDRGPWHRDGEGVWEYSTLITYRLFFILNILVLLNYVPKCTHKRLLCMYISLFLQFFFLRKTYFSLTAHIHWLASPLLFLFLSCVFSVVIFHIGSMFKSNLGFFHLWPSSACGGGLLQISELFETIKINVVTLHQLGELIL